MEIQANNLSVVSNGKTLLDKISFKIASDALVAIIGPNGAGKTTLLKSLAGLQTFSGNFLINGNASRGFISSKNEASCSYTPQNFSIPLGMTLSEYVMLGRNSYSNWFFSETKNDYNVVTNALKKLDLSTLANKLLTNLSGGEMQRATLARALAQEAKFLLLDEPTASLDFARTNQFLELISELRHKLQLTILISTHDINSIMRYADYVLVLKDGKNLHSGELGTILNKSFLSRLYDTKLETVTNKEGNPIFYAKRSSK